MKIITERKVFYIDVPTNCIDCAEQYIKNIMNNIRNKLVYDADTGQIKFMNYFQD